MNAGETSPGFRIFRASDAVDLMEAECMTSAPVSDVIADGARRAVEAGMLEGSETRVLVNIPGFSLLNVWFKAGYPLPLHSHDADCLYHIVAGSLRLGTEDLGSGDSFFVPAGVPYTYRPGPDGVELLEIRHDTHFNIVNHAKGAAFWDKAVEIAASSRDAWMTARRPAPTR